MSERSPDLVQTDFGGGQINESGSRRDALDFVRTGALRMENFRIEAIGTLVNRPCWRPLFPVNGGRTEYVRMQAGHEFFINFGEVDNEGAITIYNLDGTLSITNNGYDWDLSMVNSLSYCVAQFDIIVCGPSFADRTKNFQPAIVRWNPADQTWTFLPYSFRVINSQSQEAFYRFSVPGATMSYDGQSGTVNLTCSAPYFQDSMVGEILSIVGQLGDAPSSRSPTPSTRWSTSPTGCRTACGWRSRTPGLSRSA